MDVRHHSGVTIQVILMQPINGCFGGRSVTVHDTFKNTHSISQQPTDVSNLKSITHNMQAPSELD